MSLTSHFLAWKRAVLGKSLYFGLGRTCAQVLGLSLSSFGTWAIHFTSLSLGFITQIIGTIEATYPGRQEDEIKCCMWGNWGWVTPLVAVPQVPAVCAHYLFPFCTVYVCLHLFIYLFLFSMMLLKGLLTPVKRNSVVCLALSPFTGSVLFFSRPCILFFYALGFWMVGVIQGVRKEREWAQGMANTGYCGTSPVDTEGEGGRGRSLGETLTVGL